MPIFPRLRRSRPELRYGVPRGVCVYAIGDVHGCLEPLERLLEKIERDLRTHDFQSHLVLLGDLIDRGPQSAGVIERLRHAPAPVDRVHFVMGNHEESMLNCLAGDIRAYEPWLRYGGVETLQSYGLDSHDILAEGFDVGAAIKAAVPASHRNFIRKFKDQVRIGDCLFVHAGIRPGIPLDQQVPADLHWIRKEFLGDASDHGVTVIHGHTIVPRVQVRTNRVAVDTGCYLTGELSAVRVERTAVSILTS
ncbi:metallophosphoesterase family protein [Sphingomonas daechungensis]|uniref:metallophosphoesterase family protein n=1 Tax=Sphingomonas daechungensis TaxID=1176646 RepID=UPI0031E6B7DC